MRMEGLLRAKPAVRERPCLMPFHVSFSLDATVIFLFFFGFRQVAVCVCVSVSICCLEFTQ